MRIPELVPGIEIHEALNPKLWAGQDLRPDVARQLLKIAAAFRDYLKVPVEVLDIIVTGSQAGYSYTTHSDLDLHLIVRYSDVKCDQPVEELFDTKRKLWKASHDIHLHGVPVELYVEDLDRPVTGASYSILKQAWIKQPQRPPSYTPSKIRPIAQAWQRVIAHAIDTGNLAAMQQVKSMLMNYRQQSLKKNGESSRGNLVFKTLRNTGTIGQLMRAITQQQDQDLSLPD